MRFERPHARFALVLCTVVLMLSAALTTIPSASADNPNGNEYATAAELELMRGTPPPPDKRVNKGNALMAPPFNRWSYLNMRMFYPTASIRNADRARALQKAIDGGIEKLVVEHPEDGTSVDFDQYLMETYTDALVVIRGDKIVFERYLNGMHSDHTHQMMSVTKSFAGLFGLLAVEAGRVSEEDRVATIIPELKNSGAFGDATFGQVLDMTNSMDFSEDYADPESGIVHYATVLGFMEP